MQTFRSYKAVIIFLIVATLGAAVIALCVGRFSFVPSEAFRAIVDHFRGGGENEAMENVIFVLRLPRIFGAILIGACLALSGAVYQSVFRNPLVSPDILGVSSGASVGAALSIIVGGSIFFRQISAFAVGLLAVTISVAIPKIMKNSSTLMLVLSGTIVNGFMSSLCTLLKFVADEETQLSTIIYWQMGSVASVKTDTLLAVLPVFVVGAVILLLLSWQLNIISFGESEARTLGVNLKVIRTLTIAVASMMTASAVCISGTIGWIGLVIPHLGRLLVGSDNTKMLPCAMLMGGLFLLLIDTVARTATALEIPLSILTGVIGAPIYAWLLWKQKAKVT